MSSRLTAAVVGTGFIGPVHVEGLVRAGVQVAGIVGSTPEKARAAANRLGLARGYEAITADAQWRQLEPADLAAAADPTMPTPIERTRAVA